MTVRRTLERPANSRARTLGPRRAADHLIACYARLARDERHLLASLLDGKPPVQWQHYPADDAIDATRRYQWFYHSHDPEDRPGATEHGHFHLFVRPEGSIDEPAESQFLRRLRCRRRRANTRHLLAIGMNAVGLPISMFTVNRWVTGDLPLSANATIALLQTLRLSTGHAAIDTVLESVIALHRREIRALIERRDDAWFARAARGPGALEDRALEVPSFLSLDLDRRISEIRAPRATA